MTNRTKSAEPMTNDMAGDMADDRPATETASDRAGDRTITIKLSSPITVDGKACDEFTFREPTLGDLLEVEDTHGVGENRAIAMMMARMAGVTDEEMAAMTVVDWKAATVALEPLLGNDG